MSIDSDKIVRRALSRLEVARRTQGLSQQSLGASTGISRSVYGRLESGEYEMSLRQFVSACLGLRLDPGAVLSASDEAGVRAEAVLASIEGLLKSTRDAWQQKDEKK